MLNIFIYTFCRNHQSTEAPCVGDGGATCTTSGEAVYISSCQHTSICNSLSHWDKRTGKRTGIPPVKLKQKHVLSGY